MDLTFLPAQSNNEEGRPIIKVIGVGGAGGNAISHMIRKGLEGVEFVAINTDVKALRNCLASYKVQLGEKGTGAGARPEVGEELAKTQASAINDLLTGTDMLFIAAGMGGGTGTGAAPIIAELAMQMGILTVAVVTKPFNDEGSRRMRYAEAGIEKLSNCVNSLIVVHNEKLVSELEEDISLMESFMAADNVLYNAVSGVSDIIHEDGYIQVDFEDVRTVMTEAGESMMGSAIAEGRDRAREAAEKAIKSPLLEGAELTNAKGALVYVAASAESFKRSEFNAVLQEIKKYTAEEALIIGGVVFSDELKDKMKVTVLITGLGRQKVNAIGKSGRISDGIPREDINGNRINMNYIASNNKKSGFENTRNIGDNINIPAFIGNNIQSNERRDPSVIRVRPTRMAPANYENENAKGLDFDIENQRIDHEHEKTKSIAGIVAGEETSTITNGDLSTLQLPSFMRKQAGTGS